MSNISPIPRLVDEPGNPEPKLFVRAISAPPGLPWDQARVAGLEARVGAPLPLPQVVYCLKRLEPWGPGKTARFACIYVRSEEVNGRLDATASVDGHTVPVTFLSRREQERRLKAMALVAGVAALTTALAVVGVGMAITARQQASLQLTGLEQAAADRGRQIEARQRLQAQARALDIEGVSGRRLGDFLDDLVWASAAKAPEARIQALHWDHGYLALEARGEAAPFAQGGRPVQKFDKPVRRGVWLWGVGGEGDR